MRYYYKKPGAWTWTQYDTDSLEADIAAGRIGTDWRIHRDGESKAYTAKELVVADLAAKTQADEARIARTTTSSSPTDPPSFGDIVAIIFCIVGALLIIVGIFAGFGTASTTGALLISLIGFAFRGRISSNTKLPKLSDWRRRRVEKFHRLGPRKYIVHYAVLPISGGVTLITACLLLSKMNELAAGTMFLALVFIGSVSAAFGALLGWRMWRFNEVAYQQIAAEKPAAASLLVANTSEAAGDSKT